MTKTYQTSTGPVKVDSTAIESLIELGLRRYLVHMPNGQILEITQEEYTRRSRAKRPGRSSSRVSTSIVYTIGASKFTRLIDAIESQLSA